MPDTPPLLTHRAELVALADQIRTTGRLALDTEFVWERTYRSTLGVVQIATPGAEAAFGGRERQSRLQRVHDPN